MKNLFVFRWFDRTSVSFHEALTDNPTEFSRALRANPEIVAIRSVCIADLIEDYFAGDDK